MIAGTATYPTPMGWCGWCGEQMTARHRCTPISVPVKRCCGILLGEVCDCASFAAEYERAPEIRLPVRRPR